MESKGSQVESMVMWEQLFSGVYKNKRVLVTGHTGFKGSWLMLWLNKIGAHVAGFSLPGNTSVPSHMEVVKPKCTDYRGDICNANEIAAAIAEFKPDIVFHLAAQSLVRRSYRDVHTTYNTNVIGTLNVLEACKKAGSVKAIVNITTDKVYDNPEHGEAFVETDPLGGHDPYSASKACAEILSQSYRKSFLYDNTVLLATVRAGNVIGGGDWAEDRLITDIILGATGQKECEIRSPKSVRPWEHVLEPLSGYLLLGKGLLEGKDELADAWNFAPNKEQCLPVDEVLNKAAQQWDKIKYRINAPQEQYHEARLLLLDADKSRKKLGWQSVWNIDETMRYTIGWYKAYYENDVINTDSDIVAYVSKAREKNLIWTG